MTEAAPPSAADVTATARALVDMAVQAGEVFGRPDLVERLARARRSLDDPGIHVVVAGEFKQGKSSLVNALLGASACPVDDDVATAKPTYVRYGDPAEAAVLIEGDPVRREPIPLDDVRRHVLEEVGAPSAPVGGAPAVGVEVRLPRTLLKTGLVLVDTPGVGGLGSAPATSSLAAISVADAVLFVTDASQELTAGERAFLRHARRLCDTVVCVLTKTDFYPAWRRILELDRQHLAEDRVPVLPVSSPMRLRAIKAGDAALNQESGFRELVAFVNDRVAGGAARRLAASAAADVVAVCRQLEGQFEAEQAALQDPGSARGVVNELARTKERAEALRAAAARWQRTLGDGVGDLTSDVDHDLRSRIRSVAEEAEGLMEDLDPADVWPQMQGWLQQAVSGEIITNYTYLRDRAVELSERVADHFGDASGEVLDRLEVYSPAAALASAGVEPKLKLERQQLGTNALTALRNSYGGMAMVSVLGGMTTLATMPVVPLAGVAVGLAMGRHGLREEKRRQLQQRRSQARNAVRRYCDDVTFIIAKDSRDTLRRIHRQLRDHYGDRADELDRSSTEALRAAREAATRGTAERERRLQDIAAELARLRELRRRAEAVLGATRSRPEPAVAAGGGGR
jgi:hypothetical protein